MFTLGSYNFHQKHESPPSVKDNPGWWIQPLWKILVNWVIIPNIWKKCSKPPTSNPTLLPTSQPHLFSMEGCHGLVRFGRCWRRPKLLGSEDGKLALAAEVGHLLSLGLRQASQEPPYGGFLQWGVSPSHPKISQDHLSLETHGDLRIPQGFQKQGP